MIGNKQCKDIPGVPVLLFLAALRERNGTWFNLDCDNTVVKAMPPGTPRKLVLSKMNMLLRRGLIDGCTCGCRGDFELTSAGAAHLAQALSGKDGAA
ncbi:hypothetical protein [Massilia sp. CCM 8734]|uniref:hypothetical protein n=1 Tax=Massilia sp. CCM 8734 TaxID=2609283 RepID=UPI00141FE83C|nr:hypothetical protein [Massilia sp. CCM 8734]NHZ94634.1 hypothetical protein [Massilia sp. CCM 8734]